MGHLIEAKKQPALAIITRVAILNLQVRAFALSLYTRLSSSVLSALGPHSIFRENTKTCNILALSCSSVCYGKPFLLYIQSLILLPWDLKACDFTVPSSTLK